MFQTTTTTTIGSYLRCAYNLVSLEKTSQLYQIRCLTGLKMAAVLGVYSRMRSYIARHTPDR